MTLSSQELEDGNYLCKTCGEVFSSVEEVRSHQRVHKTGNSAPPPPMNPYDDEASVLPGEESELEEGEIRSDDDHQRQDTGNSAPPPPTSPPKNPYDDNLEEGEMISDDDRRLQGTMECAKAAMMDGTYEVGAIFSGEELELEEGEIRSDDERRHQELEEGEIRSDDERRHQETLECPKEATMELEELKKEDYSPDEIDVAEILRLGLNETWNSAPPPPLKNLYDQESELEEGGIRSDEERRHQETLECPKEATMELEEQKEDDFSLAELEFAETLVLTSDSNCPPTPVTQENHKMKEKVNQEDACLGTPIKEKVKVNSTCNKTKVRKSSDRKTLATMVEGGTSSASGRVIKEYKCDKCGKKFDSGQALGGHVKAHAIPKARAAVAGGTTTLPSSASEKATSKKFKCDSCDKIFSSGQALGGHRRMHYFAGEELSIRFNYYQPQNNLNVVNDTGLAIGLNNIPVQVPEDVTMDDGDAAGNVKKDVDEDVIMEDIHERNDDDRERSRLSFDLNQSPSDAMKGIDLNLEPDDSDED